MVEKVTAQTTSYDSHSTATRFFNVGDLVWLSQPTAGKLNPRQDGSWIVKSIHSPVTLQITNGKLDKVVHINRLHHKIQPPCREAIYSHTSISTDHTWTPPPITHIELEQLPEPQRYPVCEWWPPDRFHFLNSGQVFRGKGHL